MNLKQIFRSMLEWVSRILRTTVAGVALLAVAGGAAVWMVARLRELSSEPLSAEAVGAALTASGMLLALFLLVAFTVAFYLAARYVWGHREVFGHSPVERIIGLGVATVVFPTAVRSMILGPIYFLIGLASRLPMSLPGTAVEASGTGDAMSYGLRDSLRLFLGLVQRLVDTTSREVINNLLRYIPITDLILALVLWLLMVQLLSRVRPTSSVQQPEAERTRLGAFFRTLAPSARRNLALFMLFFIAAYLSIAAIVAIPWLAEEESPASLTLERLRDRLQEEIRSGEYVDTTYPANFQARQEPLVRLDSSLYNFRQWIDTATVHALVDGVVRNELIQQVQQAMDHVANERRIRQEIAERWRSYRGQVLDRQQSLAGRALSAFEVEQLSPMSTEERVHYFQSIVEWFQRSINELYAGLSAATEAMRSHDLALGTWAADVYRNAEQVRRELSASQPDTMYLRYVTLIPESSLYFLPSNQFSWPVFDLPSAFRVNPDPPEPGLGWGPFGWVARWLLRTKSSALALITGMLGFGLFGSVIAAFIRPVPKSDVDGVRDISSILIRGLSAAVVIFLSVKGGLAIFSTGSQEPDAYVLFFACLVGAVFSEDVWMWARTRLQQGFPAEGKARGQSRSRGRKRSQ